MAVALMGFVVGPLASFDAATKRKWLVDTFDTLWMCPNINVHSALHPLPSPHFAASLLVWSCRRLTVWDAEQQMGLHFLAFICSVWASGKLDSELVFRHQVHFCLAIHACAADNVD
jgi:hypothetical protein